jgi:hypothetical protein
MLRLGFKDPSKLAGSASLACAAVVGCAADSDAGLPVGAPNSATVPMLATNAVSTDAGTSAAGAPRNWNFHLQNTDIVQGYPGYSVGDVGPNSLPRGGEVRETVSFDVLAGVRLWSGAEAHVDGLMWQG